MNEKWEKAVANILKEELRTCGICGATETKHNLMLKYDNGLIMCDDCAFDFYENKEDEGE